MMQSTLSLISLCLMLPRLMLVLVLSIVATMAILISNWSRGIDFFARHQGIKGIFHAFACGL
jgi:hypothetical protein